VAELYQAVNTLEVHYLASCSDYPAQDSTAFLVKDIQTTNGTPSLTWTQENIYEDCGQWVTVASNGIPGQVNLNYGEASITGLAGFVAETSGTYQWYSNPRNGTGSYSFQWSYYSPTNNQWYQMGTSQNQTMSLSGWDPSDILKVTVTSGEVDSQYVTVYWSPISSVNLSQPYSCYWTGAPMNPSEGTGGVPPYIYDWLVYEAGVGYSQQVDTTNNTSDTYIYYPLISGDSYSLTLTVSDALTSASNGGTGCN